MAVLLLDDGDIARDLIYLCRPCGHVIRKSSAEKDHHEDDTTKHFRNELHDDLPGLEVGAAQISSHLQC